MQDHTLTTTTYNVFIQLDEGLLEKQQEAYAVSGVNEVVNENISKKRKQHQSAHEGVSMIIHSLHSEY